MIKLASHTPVLVISLLVGSAAVGCMRGAGGSLENVDQATQLLSSDGEEAVAANDQSAEALSDASFEASAAPDPTAAADALVNAPAESVDSGCRTRERDPNDPNTVIITLNDCTRRFGLVHVSGKEIVHFSEGSTSGTLHAEFQSQDLTFNGKPATHTASADITFTGEGRTIAWQGSWQRTNLKGEAVNHQSDLTITVDPVAHCRTRNGTATTNVGARQIETTFEDLQICRAATGELRCPTGTVVHTNKAKDKSITVEFDGSNQAVVTAPRGTFERTISCQE